MIVTEASNRTTLSNIDDGTPMQWHRVRLVSSPAPAPRFEQAGDGVDFPAKTDFSGRIFGDGVRRTAGMIEAPGLRAEVRI